MFYHIIYLTEYISEQWRKVRRGVPRKLTTVSPWRNFYNCNHQLHWGSRSPEMKPENQYKFGFG